MTTNKIVLRVDSERKLSDLEYLEQIYRTVMVGEDVKFNGKAYRRTRPKATKEVSYPYHFRCVSENIYAGDRLIEDNDGEWVNHLCRYTAVLQEMEETAEDNT